MTSDRPTWWRRVAIDAIKRWVGLSRWLRWRRGYWDVRQRVADHAANARWCGLRPRIAIASEGGDARHAYWHFLEWLARERPELRAQIHLNRIPCRLPPSARVFHAWVHDPVEERDPRAHDTLLRLEAECARRQVRVVHPARVLSNSRRDVLYARLAQVGVRTPRVILVDDDFFHDRRGLSLPLVVRHRWGHAAGLWRLDNETAVGEWWRQARNAPRTWVAGEFVDVRSDDGHYRKYRYFMAGGRGVSRHLIVSPNWEVRPADRIRTQSTRGEELAFVSTPSVHHAVFDAARQALEFDIAGIDYSYDSQGELIIWEVNPHPDLSRPAGAVGEYLAPTVHRSYGLLADWYAERGGIASNT